MTYSRPLAGLLSLAIIVVPLAGCSDEPRVDNAQVEKSAAAARRTKDLFDQTKGDFNALSADQRGELTKLHGSDEVLQRVWGNLKGGNDPMARLREKTRTGP